MYDAGKIIAGLIVFLVLITFPIWYNQASGAAMTKAEPKIETDAKECVAPTEYMRQYHLQLLNQWRDLVVRNGNRVYVGFNGVKHEMSLSNGCMKCHPNKTQFCDQCHNYVGVKPYCWDCHIEPKEND